MWLLSGTVVDGQDSLHCPAAFTLQQPVGVGLVQIFSPVQLTAHAAERKWEDPMAMSKA